MQIKKDEMEKRLLDAAQSEFMEHGFRGASIRAIVKSARTTIGNFYNYFENKEAIFCTLVDDVYNGFVYILQHHNDVAIVEIDIENASASILRQAISEQIEKVLPQLDYSFMLLIEKSNGTKYSHVKQELINLISEHFLIHIEETNSKYPYPEIGSILALQLIDGSLAILHMAKSFDQKLKLLTELMIYTVTGMIGILQGGEND